jgi:hypothetical protein
MTMPRKGSRRIVVAGVAYRWHVSRWKRISGWSPASLELLDPRWLDHARRFGLGDVADVAFSIAVELWDNPVSRTRVRYYAKVIDGFLGFEQLTQIKPQLVRTIVERAIAAGWSPNGRGDFPLEIVENTGQRHRPALLVLPGLDNDIEGYENRMIPFQIS